MMNVFLLKNSSLEILITKNDVFDKCQSFDTNTKAEYCEKCKHIVHCEKYEQSY